MNARELIRRWKDRQSQILDMLPEAVRTEFSELTVAIRRAEAESMGTRKTTTRNGRHSAAPLSAAPGDFVQLLEKMSQRVPLEHRKQQVAEFLARNGPSSRSEILAQVGIPNGSLSNVLLDQELFQKGSGNRWLLAEKKQDQEKG
jgi:hypothetical protein